MPLTRGTRVRTKTFPSGKKVLLAFDPQTNKVIETKKIDKKTQRKIKNRKFDNLRRALT